MKAAQILENNGLTPVTYSDVCFKNVLGTCSKELGKSAAYRAIAVTMEDNEIDPDGDLEAMIISFEDAKDIAMCCDILYTDMALAVHSASLKHPPFNTLKIVRINN